LWYDVHWQSRFLRPFLIALMATCLLAGPVALLNVVFPGQNIETLTAFCFFAALIAAYTSEWALLPAQRLLGRTVFRLSELLLIILVVRILTWLVMGWPSLAVAKTWVLNPLQFFDAYFIFASILVFFAWDRASTTAQIFHELGLNSAEHAWFRERQEGAWRKTFPVEIVRTSRQEVFRRYLVHWLGGGAFLVLCVGLTSFDFERHIGIPVAQLGLPSQLILAIVAYFLIGLILAAQARLAMLRVQWLYDGVDASPSIGARWQRIGLFLVLVIGLLAALLPLGSTWRAGEILAVIVSGIIEVLYLIALTIIGLGLALLQLLGLRPDALPPLEMVEQPAPPVRMAPEVGLNLPAWVVGSGFWIVVIIVLIYAAFFFLGKDGLAVSRARLAGLWRKLWAAFAHQWHSLGRLISQAQAGRGGAVSHDNTDQTKGIWRFIRLSALSPRGKIRYFYLSTVARAEKLGVARAPGQTPQEFVAVLKDSWPESQADLETLTEAFAEARYDNRPLANEQAQSTQSVWQRIKRAFQAKRATV